MFSYICTITTKLIEVMKRLFLILAGIAAAASLSAQEPEKSIAEAQIEYDRIVSEYKTSLEMARNEERRITNAANDRLDEAKLKFDNIKDEYKLVIEEQKRKVKEAKDRYDNANLAYKQEATRTKQEIAAAKAKTKAVDSEYKSAMAAAKAEIARVKAYEHEKKREK